MHGLDLIFYINDLMSIMFSSSGVNDVLLFRLFSLIFPFIGMYFDVMGFHYCTIAVLYDAIID